MRCGLCMAIISLRVTALPPSFSLFPFIFNSSPSTFGSEMITSSMKRGQGGVIEVVRAAPMSPRGVVQELSSISLLCCRYRQKPSRSVSKLDITSTSTPPNPLPNPPLNPPPGPPVWGVFLLKKHSAASTTPVTAQSGTDTSCSTSINILP